jgi:hypothetical protein
MRVTISNSGYLLEPDTSREQDVIAFLARALKQTYDQPIVSGAANPKRLVAASPTTELLESEQRDNHSDLGMTLTGYTSPEARDLSQ